MGISAFNLNRRRAAAKKALAAVVQEKESAAVAEPDKAPDRPSAAEKRKPGR
jgi:hypothetical protein